MAATSSPVLSLPTISLPGNAAVPGMREPHSQRRQPCVAVLMRDRKASKALRERSRMEAEGVAKARKSAGKKRRASVAFETAARGEKEGRAKDDKARLSSVGLLALESPCREAL